MPVGFYVVDDFKCLFEARYGTVHSCETQPSHLFPFLYLPHVGQSRVRKGRRIRQS